MEEIEKFVRYKRSAEYQVPISILETSKKKDF